MNIHYFQHVPFEGLGYIEEILQSQHHAVTATKFYEDSRLPYVDICDLLIVLGGPMSVHDQEQYPWLIEEKKFIAKTIASGKKVLGICLGAQLIAQVLGATVYPNAVKEIGWMPLQPSMDATSSIYLDILGADMTVLHWHGETFGLPVGATLLASTAACQHQAFEYNRGQVLAMQYHLEATPTTLLQMLTHCGDELIANSPYIQNAIELSTGLYLDPCHAALRNILARMCDEQ